MVSKGSLTKSGVFVFDSFKDNLIIDRYHSRFQKMRASKLKAIRSENSEDALTWNVFRTLQKIDSKLWLPRLFDIAFEYDIRDLINEVKISLWERVSTPEGIVLPEGKSEIDIIIETNQFVWFIEAKYKSDISLHTKHDPKRNQILRNIDVGTDYASEKDFYFSLLILNEKFSAKGSRILHSYNEHFDTLHQYFPHRSDQMNNLKMISLLKWENFLDIFLYCEKCAKYEDEKVLSKLAYYDLEQRINKIQ